MKKQAILAALATTLLTVSSFSFADSLTVYSGRGKAFVEPVFKSFEKETGIKVNVRYAGTPELVALLKEEKNKSPADIFWAQDGGALGTLENQFAVLPQDIFSNQLSIFKNNNKQWVGISARTRTVAYSPERVKKLPSSINDFTKNEWKGKIGWAPGNASFQAFVTAYRVLYGDKAALKWLKDIKNNQAKSYKNNTALVQAIADGEIDVAFVNNYYLPRFKNKDPKFPVEQSFLKDGDVGNMLIITGVGVLQSSKNKQNAEKFVRYLLQPATQQYLVTEGNEYAVTQNIISNKNLNSVSNIQKASPAISLDKLTDIEGTRKLLREVGLI